VVTAIRRSPYAQAMAVRKVEVKLWGGVMTAPVIVSARDLRALARVVREDRSDLPAGQGLPPSLLADLRDQVGCDFLSFHGLDADQRVTLFDQDFPVVCDGDKAYDRTFWAHYWDFVPSCYPDRSGDLRSVTKTSDFLSARQLHQTAFTATTSIRWDWSTCSGCACPPGPDGRCGSGFAVIPVQISPTATATC
jgi:hypothetical protein